MKKFVKIGDKIINVSMILGFISIFAMMMLIVVNIIMRKVFSTAILGSVEITQQMLVCIVWFGMCVCARNGEMMAVDIFKFPEAYMRVIDYITLVICVFSGIAAVKGGIANMRNNSGTTQLHIPKCIFQYITAIGFFLVAFAIILNLIDLHMEKKNRKPEEEKSIEAVNG